MDFLKNFAGHKSEKTTRQYLDYSKNEKLRYEAYDCRGDKLLSWLSTFNFLDNYKYFNKMNSSNHE